MLLRFLRLFPLFRDLENQCAMFQRQATLADEASVRVTALETDLSSARAEINELVTDKCLLEDRLSNALNDHDQLWQAMQVALENERFALRTQVNHLTQKAGAGTPYQDAHRIPETALPRPQLPGPIGRRGRVLPSQLARRQTLDNLRRMAQPDLIDDGVGQVIAQ